MVVRRFSPGIKRESGGNPEQYPLLYLPMDGECRKRHLRFRLRQKVIGMWFVTTEKTDLPEKAPQVKGQVRRPAIIAHKI